MTNPNFKLEFTPNFKHGFDLLFGNIFLDDSSEEGIPIENLLAYFKVVDGGLVDSIGVAGITFTSGDASDLMYAQFSFDSGTATLQLDALEVGDVLFDSADSMAPIVRFGYEWYALLNTSFVWIGPNGIAGYAVDMVSYASKIQTYLGTFDEAFANYVGSAKYTNTENYA